MFGRTLAITGAVLVLTSGICFAQQPAKPNDAQIAHIAYMAGEIDIKAAQQALQKSRNSEVRQFAEDMLHDYKAVNEKALALVKKLNVTLQDNDTSRALTQQADESSRDSGSSTAR